MYLQLSFFCSSLTCFNPNTLPLLKLVVKSPLTATPNGVQLGYKQFSIIVTMEFIWFASLSFAPSLFYSTFRIKVKKGVSVLVSITATWSFDVKAFVIPIFCQL
jgi:hypothetical protein